MSARQEPAPLSLRDQLQEAAWLLLTLTVSVSVFFSIGDWIAL